MNYLSVDNISKAFSDKLLFETISFGIEKGEKTALIAANGTGKSTMMRILVGKEEADGGKVTFNENVRVGYLEQLPQFDPNLTIEDVIATGHTDVMRVVKRYEEALVNQVDLDKATAAMDAMQAWSYDLRLKQLLSTFEINDLSQKIGTLSGGQVKRLALALVLLDDPDMLFLDEPTNHLDMQMVEWLENYLTQSNVTLFMVTHDRYFLDRVCNKILEMYHGTIYTHNGNFDYYVRSATNPFQLMLKHLSCLFRRYALVFLAFATFPHVIIEVAVVGVNGAVIHLENLVAYAVEEISVVSDHKQRHIRLSKVIFKPLHHLHVEVVGRLVEEKHVGVI